MAQINLQGLVNNISEKTSIYTPIIEAVVNSIQSIVESDKSEGEITIILDRDPQMALGIDDENILKVKSIEIHDNGLGFNDTNLESFNTLYGDLKRKLGGKGFGRFMFLKYFNKVEVESVYKEKEKFYQRSFSFSAKSKSVENLIENISKKPSETDKYKTIVKLLNIKDEQSDKLDKRIETIARNLVERLLPYFIDSRFKCPKIVLRDLNSDEQIVLNNFFSNYDEIKEVGKETFVLEKDKIKEEFEVKIFKIFFTKSASSVILSAHSRAVTTQPLYEYVPEFKDDFYDTISSKDGPVTKNYSIKSYVFGNYLDKHVSLERSEFNFPKEENLLYSISRKDIESKVVEIVVEKFKSEVTGRQEKKKKKIREYIDTKAPWHKSYFDKLDLTLVPFHFDEPTIEAELQKQKFKKEQSLRDKVTEVLKNEKAETVQKTEEISKSLTDLGKSDLAHYVVLRKAILDILTKSLKWSKEKKYEKEKVIHNLIFPMHTDTDHLSYDEHNLWIIDERLSFHEYTVSDRPLNKNDERPDILLFDRAVAVREGNEYSNPITIFEFKRPQRDDYDDNDDPILQICKYVEKIRAGDFKDIKGRIIKAGEDTPAYGFLICDITSKIKDFCKTHSLIQTPDREGFFGYHVGYKVYLQVISFDKLINDSELRNKVLFRKLGIE